MISVRPYITFTNRLGKDIFMKLSSEDEPKVLHASDARVSFVYRETGETSKLQVSEPLTISRLILREIYK